MTQKDIIRMALEAGVPIRSNWAEQELSRFAALVAAAERDACAKFIKHDYVRQFERPWREDLAAAIRARGQA